MQNRPSDRTKRQPTTSTPSARTSASAPTRRIDCGVTVDDGASHPRQERADARHAYLTARGTYAEQVQAV